MKKLAYITALILSLLIIYSGGGVSIVRYCCARCETVQSCCDSGCPKCKKVSYLRIQRKTAKSYPLGLFRRRQRYSFYRITPGKRNILNFQNYVAIDVNKGIREGYIDSFQSFMESLIRSSKRRVTAKEAIRDVRNARISIKDINCRSY